MMNPRIAYPLYIANQMMIDNGTMEDTEVDMEDIDMTYHWFLEPQNVSIFDQGLPTLDDFKKAFKLLGATIAGED